MGVVSTLDNPARELLTDAFGRISEWVAEISNGMSDDVAYYRPDPEANTISWLLWHLARVQDDHVAGVAGMPQRWVEGGWCERFGLPFAPEVLGYGHTNAEVGQVRVGAADLAGYHADVHTLTLRYLESVDAAELERIVDRNWDPPVTASVRLVSVLGDCLAHLGQADYVRGMAARAGIT